MKLLIALLLITQTAWAGLPPPTLQSQGGTKLPAKFDLQTPPGQATDLGGTKALIETGNDNLLTNLNFQATGITSSVVPSWTLGTGVAAAADTSVRYGNDPQSLKLTLTAATGNIISQDVPIGGSVQGTNTEESLYVNSTLTTLEVCARAAGSSLTGVCTAVPSDGLWHPVLSPGQPGTASGSIGVSLYATGSSTGTVNLSRGYVGPARNLGTVAQAQILGVAKWPATAGCQWLSTTTGSFVAPDVAASCPTPTLQGSALAPATHIPEVDFANAPAGDYEVTVRAARTWLNASSAEVNWTVYETQTATQGSVIALTNMGGTASNSEYSSHLKITQAGPLHFQVRLKQAVSSATYINLDTAATSYGNQDLEIEVKYFPPQSQIVQTTDQSDFGWTSCDTLTIGAVTTAPTKGTVVTDQCREKRDGDTMEFQYTYSQSASGSNGSGTYLFPIPNSLSIDTSKVTASATQGTVVGSGIVSNVTGGLANDTDPVLPFVYDATHIALKVQQAADAFVLFSDASTNHFSSTNLNFSFKVRVPVSQWVNTNRAPNLIGSVTSSDPAKSYHDEDGQAGTTAAPCTVSPCSPMTQTGSWVQSSGVTRTSTGVYPVAFTASEFSASPFCSAQCVSNTGCQCQSQSATTSGMTVYCTNTTTAAAMDAAFTFHCKGTR